MKIAIIQPSAELGGLEISLDNWLKDLAPSEFDRLVILPHHGPIAATYQRSGIRTIYLPMMQLRTIRSPKYQLRYLLAYLPTVLRLARVLKGENIDVVHTNSLFCLYGFLAAALVRRPHVWHIHEIPDQPLWLVRMLTTFVQMTSARVVVISPAVLEIFLRRGSSHPKVVQITEGIDVTRFNPDVSGLEVRRELGIAREATLIGWAARLDPWKGCEVFLRAAAAIAPEDPLAHFLVAGGELAGYEQYASGLKVLARQLAIDSRVTFTGWRYHWEDMPRVMASLDILVHTPISPEPLGMVLLEAMACAKPVVAANAGGPASIVLEGITGRLFAPGSITECAAAIRELSAMGARRAQLGQAGRRRVVKDYNSRIYANNMASMYRGLAKSPHRMEESPSGATDSSAPP